MCVSSFSLRSEQMTGVHKEHRNYFVWRAGSQPEAAGLTGAHKKLRFLHGGDAWYNGRCICDASPSLKVSPSYAPTDTLSSSAIS